MSTTGNGIKVCSAFTADGRLVDVFVLLFTSSACVWEGLSLVSWMVSSKFAPGEGCLRGLTRGRIDRSVISWEGAASTFIIRLDCTLDKGFS